jgi:hypothetical protein
MHVLGSRALGFAEEPFEPGDADPGSTLGWCDDQTEFEFALDLILDGLDWARQTTSAPRTTSAPGKGHNPSSRTPTESSR